MSIIILETKISAPIRRCFDLSLSIDLHQLTTSKTKEHAIAGVTSGLIGLNQTVTWKAKHFGIWQTLTTKITRFDSPHYFRDEMIQGIFRRLEHDHWFESSGNITIMKDRFGFEAPLYFLGRMAEKIFLKRYLESFLVERNKIIKEVAESDGWKKFLF